MHKDFGLWQAVQSRHMVLVHMAHHHQFGSIELGSDMVGHDRRVEHRQRVAAGNHDLVAVRVLAAPGAAKHRDAAEVLTLYFNAAGLGLESHGSWRSKWAWLLRR